MPTTVMSGRRRAPGLEARIFGAGGGGGLRAAPEPDALRGGAAAEMAADVRARQRQLTDLIMKEREMRGGSVRKPHMTPVPYENLIHRNTRRRSTSGQHSNDSTGPMVTPGLLAAQTAVKRAASREPPAVTVEPPTPAQQQVGDAAATKIVRLGCGSPPPPRAQTPDTRATLRKTAAGSQQRRDNAGWSSARGHGAYFASTGGAAADTAGDVGTARRSGMAGSRYQRDLMGSGASDAIGFAGCYGAQSRSSSAPVKPARRARTEIDSAAAGRIPPSHAFSKRMFHEHHEATKVFEPLEPKPCPGSERGRAAESSASLLDVGAHSERPEKLRCRGHRAASAAGRPVNHISHVVPQTARAGAARRSFNPILGF